jgi:hypothetical protein
MTMYPRLSITPALTALLVCVSSACTGSDASDKTPLGNQAPASAAASSGGEVLPASAQAALSAGNDAYRAGRFDDALAEYNKAAVAAPTSAAPYYGVLMAAQKVGNKPLADSASAMIKKLSGEDASIHMGGTAPANPHPARPVPPPPPAPKTTP